MMRSCWQRLRVRAACARRTPRRMTSIARRRSPSQSADTDRRSTDGNDGCGSNLLVWHFRILGSRPS